jgi:hypothetical protein
MVVRYNNGSLRNRLRAAQAVASGFVGPLDSLPTPVLAYSTRRLRSAYSGSLAEWRRASDSAVTTVDGDSAASFSITSSSPVGAGGTLGTWVSGTDGFYRTFYNQGSLASGDLQQTSAAAQFRGAATGTLDTLNSRAGLKQTAASQLMPSIGSFTQAQIATGTSFTIAVVVVTAETSQSNVFTWGTTSFGANIINILDEWSDGAAYFVGGNWSGDTLAYSQVNSNIARVTVVRRDVNALTWRRDGTTAASGTASGSFTATQTVSIGDTGRALANGTIAEIVWWASALSDTDRATYEANAKAWFGTP